MLSIIGMIIAGAIIGALARLIMRGEQNISVLWTIVLGAVGALICSPVPGLPGAATAAAAKSSNHMAINFNLCVYAARPSRYNKRDTIITSKF